MKPLQERIERFKSMLQFKNSQLPVLGACPNGWESLSRYIGNQKLPLPEGPIGPSDMQLSIFYSVYQNYVDTLSYDCDLIKCIEPMPSLPWTEAAFGCPITYTGQHFWSQSGCKRSDRLEWLYVYKQCVTWLESLYGEQYPVGQAILRGPLDILAACCGDQEMIFLLLDEPDKATNLLQEAANTCISFLEINHQFKSKCMGGAVIGQYYIWVPGTGARLQNDAMSLLSPDLYKRFVLPLDREMAKCADFNLYHIHATAFHLLDLILSLSNVQIIQVSKDEGIDSLDKMMDGLLKIQFHKKILVIKGRLEREHDLQLIRDNLDYSGLCLQFVTDSMQEADLVMQRARSILPKS